MSNLESVTFSLKFSSAHSAEPPVVVVRFGDITVIPQTPIDCSKTLTFSVNLPNDQADFCQLQIDRSGFDGATEQLLTLEQLWIDDIDATVLCHQSRYYPQYPEPWITQQRELGHDWPKFHHGWITWGWNGIWVLDCETPIYTWMLKNV